MGLDVYLVRSDDWDESFRIDEISDNFDFELYENRPEGLSDDGFHEWRKEKIAEEAKRLGLKVAGGNYSIFDTGIEKFDSRDSEKYPDHLFKVGYFRSSYNDGGINNVLRNLGIPDLYDIFQVGDTQEYYVSTDWAQALDNVNAALNAYKPIAESCLGFVGINKLRMFSSDEEEISAAQAISYTMQELSTNGKHPKYFREYSNRNGDFYLDDLDVVGVFKDWLVYRQKEPNLWYLQALEIVRETIEFVLSSPKPESWRIVWSS